MGLVMPAGGGPQSVLESRTQLPSRTFQPKFPPGASWFTSSQVLRPTSFALTEGVAEFGSIAKRKGFLSPDE